MYGVLYTLPTDGLAGTLKISFSVTPRSPRKPVIYLSQTNDTPTGSTGQHQWQLGFGTAAIPGDKMFESNKGQAGPALYVTDGGNTEESSYGATYANGEDETVYDR